MKQELGWWWPDGETHIPAWLRAQKKPLYLNGRLAYQGIKLQEAMKYVRNWRTAIDVGAHVGLWSYNLAELFETVLAYEPISAHRKCFDKNLYPNANVFLHPYGLAAEELSVRIRVPDDNSGAAHVAPSGEVVRLCCYDDMDLLERDDIDFVKIDTEGYELSALHGMERMLLRCKPTLIVEQKKGHASRYGVEDTAAVDYLKALGATMAIELGGDFIFRWSA